ncbi:MAG: hypothetical protein IJZ36_05260 [Bacilli bacterium]|nr:hypothetical protein [Bacilli bacterium]
MKILRIKRMDNLSDLDYLEKVYKKVQLNSKVKFNGKVYTRIRPKNNEFLKYAYHFCLTTKNIYDGTYLIVDEEGEEVTMICDYKLEIEN